MDIDNRHADSNVKLIQKYIFCWFVYITQSAVLLRDAIRYLIKLIFTTYSTRRDKGNNKITEHIAIFQRESQNSSINKQTKSVNNGKLGNRNALTWYRHF